MATVDVLVTGHGDHTDPGDSVHSTISPVRHGDDYHGDGVVALTHAWWFADMTRGPAFRAHERNP